MEHVLFSVSQGLNDAGELRGDCGTAVASAAMAGSANHDKMTQFPFTDVVGRIDFGVCGEAEEIFKVAVREIVDEAANSDVLVVSVGEL